MNTMHLLNALGNIQDAYILSAAQKMGYNAASTRHGLSLRRVAACLTAALLFLCLSFGTAMAVSPEFREFVRSFFITEPEIVPDHSESAKEPIFVEPKKITIGDAIEGTYVHTPVASHARNGVFLICTDEVMMNSGNHYDAYIENNGELAKLEAYTFCQEYTILGNDFHVEFEWVDAGGHCVYTYIDADATWRKQNLSGPLDATLFTFSCQIPDTNCYTEYPVLINLNTGALTDILAGTGAEDLPGICQTAISDDLSRMVLVTDDGQLYYVDIAGKKLYNVDALSGEHAEECALTDTTLTCWALEGDSIEKGTLGAYKIWAIDLNTMERRDLFSDLPATPSTSHEVWSETYHLASDTPGIWEEMNGAELAPLDVAGLHFIEGFNKTRHWSNMYSGSDFALEVDENRNVWVIDLATGEKSMIDGFMWPEMEYPDVECIPSPDGKKLLIQWRGELNYYDQIGVLDFDEKTYCTFSRENLNNVNEHTIYWFDHNSILIATSSHDSVTDYYIYRLLK